MAVLPVTSTAPAVPGDQVFLDATGKLPVLDGSQLTGVVSSPGLHAATHKHGGGDEVATATPGANEIPKAGGTSTLATGWLPAATEGAQGAQEIATQVEVDTGTDDTRTVSPLKLATTPRLPTQVENDALQGTSGAPSNTNRYVTDADARNTNDRTASGLRTASTVVSVSAAVAPTSGQVLTATGGTAATWQTPSASGATPAIEEHFVTSNITNNTIAKLGWRTTGNGTSNALTSSSIPGHPGVLSMNPGTATATGKRAIYLGQPAIEGGFLLSTTGLAQPLEIEWLIQIRGTVGSASLEMIQLGLAPPVEDVTTGLLQNSLCVQFNPGVSTAFRVSATNTGVQSASNGTTVVAVDTWYRVSVEFTDTGAGGSAQLKINGVAEGTPVTTNFPTIALGLFAKIDGQGAGGTDPIVDMDRLRVFQTVSP